MGTPKNKSVEEYKKKFFTKKEEEYLNKSSEIFESIKKDLSLIEGLKDYEKEELLRKIKDYANCSVSAFDFFIRGKNVD